MALAASSKFSTVSWHILTWPTSNSGCLLIWTSMNLQAAWSIRHRLPLDQLQVCLLIPADAFVEEKWHLNRVHPFRPFRSSRSCCPVLADIAYISHISLSILREVKQITVITDHYRLLTVMSEEEKAGWLERLRLQSKKLVVFHRLSDSALLERRNPRPSLSDPQKKICHPKLNMRMKSSRTKIMLQASLQRSATNCCTRSFNSTTRQLHKFHTVRKRLSEILKISENHSNSIWNTLKLPSCWTLTSATQYLD